MFKELYGSIFAIKFFALCLSLFSGLFYSPFSLAACSWQAAGIMSATNTTNLKLNSSSFRLIANKLWYEDRLFPPGTSMAVDTLSLKGFICIGLPELVGKKVDFVYVPPIGATPSGAGYLVPGNTQGVAMKVEFLTGSSHPHGILFGTSTGTVSGAILSSRAGVPSISLRLTLVKTGRFVSSDNLKWGTHIVWFPEGLGWLRYYAEGDPALVAAAGNQLVMGDFLEPNIPGGRFNYPGAAQTPLCTADYLGDVPLNTKKVFRLQPVSSSDFSGAGPIDRAAQALPLKFRCQGTINTDALVTFDASFPLNGGANGVGMPEADSDIGVQLLIGDVPVRFGAHSAPLPWSKVRMEDQLNPVEDIFEGVLSPQGLYCLADCDDAMAGPNWVDGGAAQGFNFGMEPLITFRYYQTTSQRPLPRKFSVPFTITMDWN